MYLIDSRVAKRLAKSWQGGSGHGSGGRGGGGEGGGRGGGGEGEEGGGGQQNWSCGKKFPLLPCLVQVCYCYSRACKGGTLCGPVFLFFLNKGFIRKSSVLDWDQISGI